MAPAVAAIGLGATAIGSVVGAAGSLYSGFSNAAMYNYQAGIARMNAQINRQNANYAIQTGEIKAQKIGMEGGQVLGNIKAQQGASGLAYGSGTGASVRAGAALKYAAEQEFTRGDAAKRAYDYEVAALSDDAQAKADSMAADTAKITGGIGAFTSILGGAGSFSSKWLQAKSMGITPSFDFGDS